MGDYMKRINNKGFSMFTMLIIMIILLILIIVVYIISTQSGLGTGA